MLKLSRGILVALLLVCPFSAHAQHVREFALDVSEGNPYGASLCADPSGAIWVMWHGPPYNVRLQRLLASGDRDPRWPEGGLVLHDTSSAGRGHTVLPDGSGGVYVAMVRTPLSTHHTEVRVLHVRSDGTFDPAWGAAGMLVHDGTSSESDVQVAMAFDLTGAMVVGRLYPDHYWTGIVGHLHMHRLFANGTKDMTWTSRGIEMPLFGGHPRNLHLSSHPGQGVLVAFDDTDGPRGRWIRCFEHLMPWGSYDSAWPLHANMPGDYEHSYMTTDGMGGAFTSYFGGGPAGPYDQPPLPSSVWVHHLRSDGVRDPAWPASGVWLDSWSDSYWDAAPLCADGEGGLFAVWYDVRNGSADVNQFWTDRDLRVQHVLASGVRDPAWPDSGRVLAAAPGDQSHPMIVANGPLRAIVVWQDDRSGIYPYDRLQGESDVMASFIDGRPGASEQVTEPVVVSSANGAQVRPTAVPAANGAFVVWEDARSTVGQPEPGNYRSDLFGARLQFGSLGVPQDRRGLRLACETPVRAARLRVHFELPVEGDLMLRAFDIAGRELATLSRERQPAGRGAIAWELGVPLGPGVYWLTLEHAGTRATRRWVVIR